MYWLSAFTCVGFTHSLVSIKYLSSLHTSPLRHSFFFFFQAEDGIRDIGVTGVQTCAFFFQAEDGIRDIGVTGVQTCALPISTAVGDRAGVVGGESSHAAADIVLERATAHAEGALQCAAVGCRSEERRVGKECRSRWSPYH